MVASTRTDGGTQLLSARVRKTIQSIKEIVGNHSDAEIYVALTETNMDPNETTQKLLNQDPFHEVKRKKDRKESTSHKSLAETKKHNEHASPWTKLNTYPDQSDRRGGYGWSASAGVNQEFRIVRDNRANPNSNGEPKPVSPHSISEHVNSYVSEKGSTGTFNNQKPSGGRHHAQMRDGPTVPQVRQPREVSSTGIEGKELHKERWVPVQATVSQVQVVKSDESRLHSTAQVSNLSVVGVYSSSSDPVHVPSPESRAASNVGAIKREVGVVGVRRQLSENLVKPSSTQGSSFSNSHLVKDSQSSREPLLPFAATTKIEPPSQTSVRESVVSGSSVNRSFINNQYNSRPSQQVVGHPKASQPSKEWKPKSSKKPSTDGHGLIETPSKSVPSTTDNSKNLKKEEVDQLQDKLSRVDSHGNDNVIIAEHIRVTESDRCRLTFGSFGKDFDSTRDFISGSQGVGNEETSTTMEPSPSLSASTPEPSIDETSSSKHVDLPHELTQKSRSISPASGTISERLHERKNASSPEDLDNYADIGLVQDNGPSYTPLASQNQQDPPEFLSFSAYDPQTGYNISYFRPTIDETVGGQGLPSPQEALNSHTANTIPSSTISMVQQQPPPVAQMYPQVHVSHFANLMPYRQFLSPVYVPPMPMPGYSSNPTYPHPSNGNSYLLMPAASSHLSANSLKYGIQQFKPVPAGSPTGFGNFTCPTGYAINAPGVVNSATGLDDSSGLKYKDGNLYVPNPQAEASEIWIQNPRELSGLQSASYYNMPGQSPHAAYLPSHTGHASFNPAAALAQSSHMQFPGLYHPPSQPPAIANPHHLGAAMGGNVGVGVAAAAPGAQVGAYHQPQLGHLNWTTDF